MPIARQGVMDLYHFDINKKGKLALDGEWEFYYNQLFYPADFKNRTSLKPDAFAIVPGYWNELDAGSKKHCSNSLLKKRTIHIRKSMMICLLLWRMDNINLRIPKLAPEVL